MAPMLVSQADKDGDAKLTREEIAGVLTIPRA